MNQATQKLLLEHLISSKDLYARCSAILKPSYFDLEYKRVMALIHAYYQLYSSLPSREVVHAETDVALELREMGYNELSYWSNKVEEFAKQSAMKAALQASVTDMVEGNFDKIYQSVSEALKITLDRDLGLDLFADPKQMLEDAAISMEYIPTGIKILDDCLGGGVCRKETTLFSANSGVGKSIIMQNLSSNMAQTSLHVLYATLELPEDMVGTRMSSIATGEAIKSWRTNIDKIANKLLQIKQSGHLGSFIIKRFANGATANDIRAYLKNYELEFERLPDIIIVDYLDLMHPNGGTKGLDISQQDKLKSEQLYEIGVECNAHIFTASQQNRSGITEVVANQSVIAGGFSKINIVNNYISLKMDDVMRLEGIMIAHFLKTRSSDAVGKRIPLRFNPINLQVTDMDVSDRIEQILARFDKKQTSSFTKSQKTVTIQGDVEGLTKEDDASQQLINFIEEL